MPVEHASDLGQTAVHLGRDPRKRRHEAPAVELLHLRKALPPALQCAGELRELLDQAAPGTPGFPYVVAIEFRAVEQTGQTRACLRGFAPERVHVYLMPVTDGGREILREELALGGHQPADGAFEGVARAGRPEDKPDRAVAQDADRRFLETEDDRFKIMDGVDAAGDRKQRRAEPGHMPEIPTRRTKRHEGAEADENAHA